MIIRSPPSLHYPITVTRLLAEPDGTVDRFAPLFSYTYTSKVTEGNKYGDELQVEKTFPAEFQSETAGKLLSWSIKAGDVLQNPGLSLLNIEEQCMHEVTFGGICANCGTILDEEDNYLTTEKASSRATVNMSHSNTALKVSQREASRISEESKRRLLEGRKLSLVVDLDQTIIHATVDPTVAEWQKDPSNPNYEAVKNVRSFQLVDDGPGGRGCWYYIKLRPGLEQFLEEISKKYELHIYTMGTRAYAQNIAKIVDPSQKVFGDRILSRDESGSLTVKTLQRLFPVDTDMVVIIDDRGDVWQWSQNLIKVTPYDFFVGIGDINSSFLPKRTELVNKSKPIPLPATTETSDEKMADEQSNLQPQENGEVSTTTVDGGDGPSSSSTLEDQLVAMSGGDNPSLIEEQSNAQAEAIAAQVTDRPLLKKQEMLDKKDEEEENKEPNGEDISETSSDQSQKQRHNLLHDDDEELRYLQSNLESIHRLFFDEYDQKLKGSAGGRVAQLRGEKTAKKPATDDMAIVPDVKEIMPQMKMEVLQGVVICFTGVIPQGIDHATSDIGMWASSFGARISPTLTKSTTHVVAHKDRRTSKVRQAAKHPYIKIVTIGWLLQCFTQWAHVDEEPHQIEVERDEQGPSDSLPFEDIQEGMTLTPSEADAEEDGALPDDVDDDGELQSPTIDDEVWERMNQDLEDFMNESGDDDDDDDGAESDGSTRSGRSIRSTSSRRLKRKRAESVDVSDQEDSDASASGGYGSELQKRKKRALERTTGLANVATAENPSGLPSPDTTGPEEEVEEKPKVNGDAVNGDAPNGDVEEEDDEFAREMMAEFERESGEE